MKKAVVIDKDWAIIHRKELEDLINSKVLPLQTAESLSGLVSMLDAILDGPSYQIVDIISAMNAGSNVPELNGGYPFVKSRYDSNTSLNKVGSNNQKG